jgi:DNA repair protein RadD
MLKQVKRVEYKIKNNKANTHQMLVAEYFIDGERWPTREFVCLDHDGFALKKAHDWWEERAKGSLPRCVEEAFERLSDIYPISHIDVEKEDNSNFDRVVSVVRGDVIETAIPQGLPLPEPVSFEEDDIPF